MHARCRRSVRFDHRCAIMSRDISQMGSQHERGIVGCFFAGMFLTWCYVMNGGAICQSLWLRSNGSGALFCLAWSIWEISAAVPSPPSAAVVVSRSAVVVNRTSRVTDPTSASPAEFRKAQREVEAFHQFRELSHEPLEVNEKICRARPVEDTLTPQEKNCRSDPAGSRTGSKRAAADCF